MKTIELFVKTLRTCLVGWTTSTDTETMDVWIHNVVREHWPYFIKNFRTLYCVQFCKMCTCYQDVEEHKSCDVCCGKCSKSFDVTLDEVLWFTLESDLTLDISSRNGVLESFEIALQKQLMDGRVTRLNTCITYALKKTTRPAHFLTLRRVGC